MNFQFRLGGVPLETSEAAALLNMSNGSSKAPVIDLETLIGHDALDAGKLFEMAVSKQDQSLASLAWKISIQQQNKTTTKKPETPKLKVVRTAHSDLEDLEEIIEYLNNSSSYSAMGVAMLLRAASRKEWITLRATAIQFANQMWSSSLTKKGFAMNSKMFRGFEFTNGSLSPVDLSSGVERRNTFHVSPMYIALREGLIYCKQQNLVEQEKCVSVGAPYATKKSPQADSTRRIYYRIKASERGKELTSMWADLDRYIEKTFELQAAS